VSQTQPDAVVVGSGPNGLMAAVRLARAGRRVTVYEAADTFGGGLRSAAVTLPGFVHDVCSAVHPTGIASPAFAAARLEAHGLRWIQPSAALAHPLDDGRAAILDRDLATTADRLGVDARAYERLMAPMVDHGAALVDGLLSPFQIPRAPITLARFGVVALRSAQSVARARFESDEAQALLSGAAAHSFLALDSIGTAGMGLFLLALGHIVGWPVAEGGSQQIANALVASLRAAGGDIQLSTEVTDLAELPAGAAVLLDLTPRQVLRVAGDRLPERYAGALRRYRYGPGVYKIDWALDGPIPWRNPEIARAATVHVGGTRAEIAHSERTVHNGRHADRPFAIVVQPSIADPSRAPAGQHTAWGYCHVPNGSTVDMTNAIETQIERFAPGFRDRVIARHTMNTEDVHARNANYVGGDINGGAADIRQLFTRPVISPHPWVTPVPGLYLCSSSTPPGGGVHGMCGWHAAGAALRRELR
jgi:phytoene dehydrogenase-like protein